MIENKTNINCDAGILRKMYSNHWKYWIFNIEIFTYFYKARKKWEITKKVSKIA